MQRDLKAEREGRETKERRRQRDIERERQTEKVGGRQG